MHRRNIKPLHHTCLNNLQKMKRQAPKKFSKKPCATNNSNKVCYVIYREYLPTCKSCERLRKNKRRNIDCKNSTNCWQQKRWNRPLPIFFCFAKIFKKRFAHRGWHIHQDYFINLKLKVEYQFSYQNTTQNKCLLI